MVNNHHGIHVDLLHYDVDPGNQGEKKMKKFLIPGILIVILVVVCLGQMGPHYSILNFVWADSYGNDIISIEIWQYNFTNWNLIANFTSSGGSVRVHDSWAINLTVQIRLNETLATSKSEAISYTKVFVNITYGDIPTYVWTNKELNNTSCTGPTGGFYYLKEQGHWNETGKPESGITYACSTQFKAYY